MIRNGDTTMNAPRPKMHRLIDTQPPTGMPDEETLARKMMEDAMKIKGAYLEAQNPINQTGKMQHVIEAAKELGTFTTRQMLGKVGGHDSTVKACITKLRTAGLIYAQSRPVPGLPATYVWAGVGE